MRKRKSPARGAARATHGLKRGREVRIGISGWTYKRFVYFDNDAKVHAPFDAQRLASLLAQ